MIFFVSNDGTIIKNLPSPVYEGGADTNTIYLVAPFASNLSATVAFQLPNGVLTSPAAMTPQNGLKGIVNEKTGQAYACWSYAMPNEITRWYGTVTAQFFFYGNGFVTPTSATSFSVQRGVAAVLPETPSQSVYEEILDNLAALQSQINNGAITARSLYAWNSTYTYGAGEIVYYPNLGEFGAFVKSIKTGNVNHSPYDENGNLDTEWWSNVLDFGELHKAIVLWGFNSPTVISELEWTEK